MKYTSLRNKITFLSIALISIALLSITILHLTREQSLFTQQSEIAHRHLTETFSISITNALLYEEIGLIEEGGLIENYIDEWMRKNDLYIEYIKVTDRESRIIASNELREYGQVLDDAINKSILNSDSTLTFKHENANGDLILDVATPLNISTKSWGHLRVGYSLEPMKTKLFRIWLIHGLVAFFIILAAAVIVIFYLRRVLDPLAQLRDFVDRASNELWIRADINSNDEIGDLSRTFNKLLDDIENARELERETQVKFYQTEKVATIGKLAAGVAHEVRNPLAGIMNLVENLERYQLEPKKQQQYIDVIIQGLSRIEKTVNGLVSFARQSPFSPEAADAEKLVEDTLQLVTYALKKSNIPVKREYTEDISPIFVDADQIRQVLLNIVLNAIDAMEEGGGLLTVYIQNIEPAGVKISFEDQGIGIPSEKISKIFDPFYTTQPAGKGTGLGLAVSKSILEEHNGRIEVKSEEGKGSVFSVILPALTKVT